MCGRRHAAEPKRFRSSVSVAPIVAAIACHRGAAAAYARSKTPSDDTHAKAAEGFDDVCKTEASALHRLRMFADQLLTEFDSEWGAPVKSQTVKQEAIVKSCRQSNSSCRAGQDQFGRSAVRQHLFTLKAVRDPDHKPLPKGRGHVLPTFPIAGKVVPPKPAWLWGLPYRHRADILQTSLQGIIGTRGTPDGPLALACTRRVLRSFRGRYHRAGPLSVKSRCLAAGAHRHAAASYTKASNRDQAYRT